MKNLLNWFAGILADEIKKRLLEADVKISILSLKPGDRIILRHSKHLSDNAHARLTQQAEEIFLGHKVVVLEEGMDIKVCRMKDSVAPNPHEEIDIYKSLLR